MESQTLKELCRVSGGDCGGTSVDTDFLNVMKKVFGEEIATEFQTNDTESFLELLRNFESIKRTIKTKQTGSLKVNIPYVTLSKFCKLKYNKTLEEQVDSSELKASFSVKNGNFKIEIEFLRGLFAKTLTNLNSIISNTF